MKSKQRRICNKSSPAVFSMASTIFQKDSDLRKSRKIVLIGSGEFGEIAHEYFTYDSDYEVMGFAVEDKYLKESSLFGKPVIPFSELPKYFPPESHEAFVSITYTGLNRVRTRLYQKAKQLGYHLATYVSSKAVVWRNVSIGENCFIFELNNIQYHAKLGNNVILWSGNQIGHRSVIADNTYITSHVCISGYVEVGQNCFFGVNSSIGDNLKIEDDCIIGAGAVLIRPAERGRVYVGNPAKPIQVDSFTKFNVHAYASV